MNWCRFLRKLTGLQGSAIVAGSIVVESLADDLAALHDDAAVAEAERGERCLLQAQVQVIVRPHFWAD